MTFTLYVDDAALARAPAGDRGVGSRPRPGHQGQRLRPRQRAAGRRRPRCSVSTPWRSARRTRPPLVPRALPRRRAGADAVVPRRRSTTRPGGWCRPSAHLPTLARRRRERASSSRPSTSMHRHGLAVEDVPALAGLLGGVRLEGLAFHLPMDRHGGYEPAAEVAGWLQRLAAAGVPTDTAWVSHLEDSERGRLRSDFPATTFRPRIGTSLWLGDRGALDGTRHGAGRAPARARHALRLPAAAGDPGQPPGGGQRRHRARRGTRGAADGARAGRARQGAGRRDAGGGRTWRCRRSGGPASSAGSPSRRTCTCRCCCCRPPSSRPRSAPSSTATSG